MIKKIDKKAFTLIEVIVVVAIIGIVASFCAILVVTLFTVAKKVVEQTK